MISCVEKGGVLGWTLSFEVSQRSHSLIDSGQLFEKCWYKSDHIREYLRSEILGVAIRKVGKVCWGYICYKRHSKTWYAEEGCYKGHIIHRTLKFVFSSIDSLLLPYLVKLAAQSE